jgi:Transposase DDE domain group 1
MSETKLNSGYASLVWAGMQFQKMKIWEEVKQRVQIQMQTRQHSPSDKLLDGLVTLLMGGQWGIEIDRRLRAEQAVQLSFGRKRCADQSNVSRTLKRCTAQNVEQMREALKQITQRHSRSYRHDYANGMHVLDIDTTGKPCGPKAEKAEKGYFPGAQHHRRGRQVGRVVSGAYDEVIVDRLYPGGHRLDHCVHELMRDVEQTLNLIEDQDKRRNTIIRMDAGGGTDGHINELLARHYHLSTKVYNWRRAHKLAKSVTLWQADPNHAKRELGWVVQPFVYHRSTRQLAIRHLKKNGQWSYSVIVFTLSDSQLATLLNCPVPTDYLQIMLNALHFYDLRGGGAETCNKSDKQSLALAHYNKHTFPAQEMMILISQLAHNFTIWMRDFLSQNTPRFATFGISRMIRDLFHISGSVTFDSQSNITCIELNPDHPLAPFVMSASGSDSVFFLRKI